MSERLANLLNLELAWHRIKFDIPDRVFVTNPYLVQLVEQDLRTFLAGIREHVARGYTPAPGGTCHEPKGKWQVRPGALLRMSDEILFNALVGQPFQQITRRLQWSQRRSRCRLSTRRCKHVDQVGTQRRPNMARVAAEVTGEIKNGRIRSHGRRCCIL